MDITLNTWTHPTTGQQRRYLDSAQVADMWVDDQGRVSRADMGRIESAKFWLDERGALHIDRLEERGRIDAAAIRAMIETALASQATEPEATEPAATDEPSTPADVAYAHHVAGIEEDAEQAWRDAHADDVTARPRPRTMRAGWSNARRYHR